MTKAETISVITAELAKLDEARVRAIAEIVRSMSADSHLPRDLTRRELELIEQSKQDFHAGYTLTLAEARKVTDQFLAETGVPSTQP